MLKKNSKKLSEFLPDLQEKVLLKNYTTFKIGGPAKYFFIAKNKEDLILAVKTAKKLKIPVFVMGGGSNILFSDRGFNGLVIKIAFLGIKLENGKIYARAGTELSRLANFCVENGFGGMEWAMGVPGTVGGAVFGNAQAFGDKISESVESIEVLDIKNAEIKTLSKEQCKFSLKNSIFKKNKALIILSVIFNLKKDSRQNIQEKIDKCLQHRKIRHPINFPSAGSVFVNPEIKIKNKKILDKYPELAQFNEKGVIPAGYLIQKSGLAGKKIGKAQISELHCNFIINLGGAKAKDVFSLIKLAQKKVKNNFGIFLVPEVRFAGF